MSRTRPSPLKPRIKTAARTSPVIDPRSYVPLYVQIRRHLRRVIEELRAGDREAFPGDAELAARFGVSRMTVRQAVSELVAEGLLTRVRGVGTFIASAKMSEEISPIGDFFVGWPSQGKTVTVHILALKEHSCPASVAPVLGLTEGDPIVYLYRRRSAGGIPIAIDHRFFPVSVGRALSKEALLHSSIHVILGPHLPEPASSAQVDLEAARATEDESRELQVLVSSPLLVRTATIFSTSGRALWTGRSLYRADLYRYSIRVPVRFAPDREAEPLAAMPD